MAPRSSLVLALVLAWTAATTGQVPSGSADEPCVPGWIPTFGQTPGVWSAGLSSVATIQLFDDGGGAGPRLFIGGAFEWAGGQPADGIAAWDGERWTDVGGSITNAVGAVRELVVFDDGSGSCLYAGGSFTEMGGTPALHVARWDGRAWSAVAGGIGDEAVNHLAVFDDGAGARLYATSAGGSFPVDGRVWRLDGASWTPIGAAMSTRDYAAPTDMAVFDDGSGAALYVSGGFASMSGVTVGGLAKWNGASWAPVVAGADGGGILTLAVGEAGGRQVLYAGGDFGHIGGVFCDYIAAFDGASWSPLGPGPEWIVLSIATFDDGSGPAVYATGSFESVERWDGTAWSPLAGGGMDGHGNALHPVQGGELGPALYVGGSFNSAGSMTARRIAAWDASGWSVLGRGLDGPATCFADFDDGSGDGPALCVGGGFTLGGEAPLNHVGQWRGGVWSQLGSGVDGPVHDLEVHDDGTGAALYAGGNFITASGVGARRVARWNGASWSALGSAADGPNAAVAGLQAYDAGSGAELYACGGFSTVSAVAMTGIARWDGSSWSSLNGSLNGSAAAMVVYDDGNGPALFVGGSFTVAGHVPANRVARWNGSSFTALGSGLAGPAGSAGVTAMAVFDSGAGPELYVSGLSITTAGGLPFGGIARWDGASWSAVGGGLDGHAWGLAVYDDGDGAALYAAGDFDSAGGVPAAGLARWDGSTWSVVEGSPPVDHSWLQMPQDVAVLDDHSGTGPALFVGGSFPTTPGSGDSFLAKFGGCTAPEQPWTNLGFSLPGVAGPPSLVGTGPLTAGSAGSLVLAGAAPQKITLLFVAASGTPTPFQCGTLVPLPILMQVVLFTSAGGGIPLAWASWPGGLSGLDLHFQYAIQDPAAACGVALSNALRADVP